MPLLEPEDTLVIQKREQCIEGGEVQEAIRLSHQMHDQVVCQARLQVLPEVSAGNASQVLDAYMPRRPVCGACLLQPVKIVRQNPTLEEASHKGIGPVQVPDLRVLQLWTNDGVHLPRVSGAELPSLCRQLGAGTSSIRVVKADVCLQVVHAHLKQRCQGKAFLQCLSLGPFAGLMFLLLSAQLSSALQSISTFHTRGGGIAFSGVAFRGGGE